MNSGGSVSILKSATLLVVAAVAACSTSSPGPTRSVKPHYKVGSPYVIDGRRYVPKEDPAYREVGLASWYGDAFHGKPTANGEQFDKNRISAAHKTLPLPSMVRVDNLDNGRSIIVRVNDRGPFVDDRIIDLSEAAAEALEFRDRGLARVRVSFLNLADLDATPPRRAQKPTKRSSSSSTLARKPIEEEGDALASLIEEVAVAPAKPHENRYWIALGAFADLNAAQSVTFSLSDIGPSWIESATSATRDVHTVFFGPYTDAVTAEAWRAAAIDAGYREARLITAKTARAATEQVESNEYALSNPNRGDHAVYISQCAARAGPDRIDAC